MRTILKQTSLQIFSVEKASTELVHSTDKNTFSVLLIHLLYSVAAVGSVADDKLLWSKKVVHGTAAKLMDSGWTEDDNTEECAWNDF